MPGALVGRREELASLARLLASDRVVTVLGPAGVGKTRLALEQAARWPGRVVSCQLADARTREDLADRVAAALGVQLASPDAAWREIGSVLASDPDALVVLDTVDRVTGPLEEALGHWTAAAPEARFLATSRVPIGLER